MKKVVLALEKERHNELPLGRAEAKAYASRAYQAALAAAAAANRCVPCTEGDYERLKSLRQAAAIKIEVWRTANANYRAMKK